MHGIRPQGHSYVHVTLFSYDMFHISMQLLFICAFLTMLLFMPYMLSKLLVLTPLLWGLRFMPRKYTKMRKSYYRRRSSEVGELQLALECNRVSVLCYDVLFEVRNFADRVVVIGCQFSKRLHQPMCHTCYDISFI